MKSLNTLIIIIGLLAFLGCEDNNTGPVLNSSPDSPAITSPEAGKSYVLTEESASDTLLTLQWTEPDYGFPAATNFVIQMSKPGADFAEAIEVGTTHKTSYAITVAGMNNRLLAAGLPPEQQVTPSFRVVASINDSLTAQVSEPLPLSFTPYEVIITYPEIYVPGSYQAASGYANNWAPADAPALYSVESNGQYEGYVYMAESNNTFKFTDERSWDLNWGDTGGNGTLEKNSPDNIALANPGYYKINVDLNTLTYSTLNTSWGLIGSATPNGWDADMDMTYDPAAKTWSITTSLTAGAIKFRANDAWNLSYGDNQPDGKLDAGGDNIVVEKAGNYTVILDLSTAPYSYTLKKN